MTVKELLSGIGDIHDAYIMEAEEYKERKCRPQFRRVMILAAVLTALLVLSAAAVTGNWFGLRELILGDAGEKGYDMISLAGLAQTPEYLAAAEWEEFLASYDTDGKILESIGNGIFAPGSAYSHYNVYSQEMADKLDEIAEKHQLKLHTDVMLNLDKAGLYTQVGGDFLGDNHAIAAYMYEDGTFHFDGDTELAGYGLLDYQFARMVKGSFNPVGLNIGSAEDYTQWNYTAQDGVTLLLAISPHKGLIVADLEDCFVTVNVLAGTETERDDLFSNGPLTAEDLQRFADSFRFSVLTPVREVDASLFDGAWNAGKISPEDFYNATGLNTVQAQTFYSGFLSDIEDGDRMAVAEKILYPTVVTVNGVETKVENASQFLAFYDDIFTEELWENITVSRYDLGRADLFWSDGLVGAAGGSIWFGGTEDGILVFTVQNSTAMMRPRYSGISGGELYDTREEAYVSVLEDLFYRSILPDGTVCEPGELMESNHFAVADVTGDGKEELVLLFTDTYTAGQTGFVVSYDERSGACSVIFTGYPMFAFYNDGYLRAYASHNHGAAGEALWPYTLYQYDDFSNSYREIAAVDAWSKEITEIYQGKAFPEEVDQEGAGIVYFVMEDGTYDSDHPLSHTEYETWLSTNVGHSVYREMEYLSLTRENIDMIR